MICSCDAEVLLVGGDLTPLFIACTQQLHAAFGKYLCELIETHD